MTAAQWAERLRDSATEADRVYPFSADQQFPLAAEDLHAADCRELAAILERAEALAGALEDVDVRYDSAGYPHQEQVQVQEECEHCGKARVALDAIRKAVQP